MFHNEKDDFEDDFAYGSNCDCAECRARRIVLGFYLHSCLEMAEELFPSGEEPLLFRYENTVEVLLRCPPFEEVEALENCAAFWGKEKEFDKILGRGG